MRHPFFYHSRVSLNCPVFLFFLLLSPVLTKAVPFTTVAVPPQVFYRAVSPPPSSLARPSFLLGVSVSFVLFYCCRLLFTKVVFPRAVFSLTTRCLYVSSWLVFVSAQVLSKELLS